MDDHISLSVWPQESHIPIDIIRTPIHYLPITLTFDLNLRHSEGTHTYSLVVNIGLCAHSSPSRVNHTFSFTDSLVQSLAHRVPRLLRLLVQSESVHFVWTGIWIEVWMISGSAPLWRRLPSRLQLKALKREFLSLYTGQANDIEVTIGSDRSFVGVLDRPN